MRYIKSYFLIISLIIISRGSSFAQKKNYGIENKELLKKIKIADELFENHSYYNAQDHYELVLKALPQNEYVLYKAGMTYFKARDYRKSEEIFKKVYEWKKNKTAYPLSIFHYGASLKMNGKYDEAKKVFLMYLKTRGKGKEEKYYKSIVRNEIKSCVFALEMVAFDTVNNVSIQQLPGEVNNAYSDFSPFQLGNDTLVFASIRSDSVIVKNYNGEESHPVKLYQSVKEGNDWASPTELENINHPYDQTANGVYSSDKKTFYFTRCRPNMNLDPVCAIYTSVWENGKWSKPKKLNKHVNQRKYSSTQPTLGVVVKTVARKKKEYPVLYFSSNRPKGRGSYDIWYSTIDKKGKFGKAVNCGNRINTLGNEVTPHYDNQKKALFFSSDFHLNAGGFDVFKSQGSLNRWSKVENLRFPINSSFDDTYFNTTSGVSGYLVSNRPGGAAFKSETCCDDIYRVEIFTPPSNQITGIVRPANPLKGAILKDVRVGLLPTGRLNRHLKVYKGVRHLKDSISWMDKSDSTGSFNFQTLKAKKYSILFAKDSFDIAIVSLDSALLVNGPLEVFLPDLKDSILIDILNKENVKVASAETSNDESLKAFSSNLKEEVMEGEVFLLDKVIFDSDKAEINKETMAAVDQLFKFLKNNPDINVEISGHTDNVGTEEYNLQLSEKRADKIRDYLIKKGINKRRLVAIGYGESNPIAPNENPDGTDNPEGRKVNRRTEIKILGELD